MTLQWIFHTVTRTASPSEAGHGADSVAVPQFRHRFWSWRSLSFTRLWLPHQQTA